MASQNASAPGWKVEAGWSGGDADGAPGEADADARLGNVEEATGEVAGEPDAVGGVPEPHAVMSRMEARATANRSNVTRVRTLRPSSALSLCAARSPSVRLAN